MRFTLEINTANAAFHNDECSDNGDCSCEMKAEECERIIKNWVARGCESEKLRDSNGNTVGFAKVPED